MINEEAKPLRNMTRGMVAMYFCKREVQTKITDFLSFVNAFVDELGVKCGITIAVVPSVTVVCR